MPRFHRLLPLSSQAPTPAAQHRFEVIRWHEQHGQIVRLTARHFGHSPDTVSRWLRAFGLAQMRGLEDKSRRPVHVRQPTTPTASVLRIKELREQYPRWGREKLRVLLERSFLTDDLEFHEVEELVPTAEGLERQLADWNHVYEEIRPHQSLGYLTPNQFYAKWAAEHPQATTLLSEMS